MAVDLIPFLGPAAETLLWVALLMGLMLFIPLYPKWKDPEVELDWPPHWD